MYRTTTLNRELTEGALKAPHDPRDQAILVIWMTSHRLPHTLVNKAAVLATRFAKPLALIAITQLATRDRSAMHQPEVLRWVLRNQKLLQVGAEVVANAVRS